MKELITHKMKHPLSLLDIDRVLGFYAEIVQKFKGVRIYLRMDKGGFELKDVSARARSMINRLGGFSELNYIEASADNFLITAEFSSGELKISSKNKRITGELSQLWGTYITKIPTSSERNILRVSLLTEAKRFMLNCLKEDGRLSKSPEENIFLNHDYLVPKLKELGMGFIVNRYAEFLLNIQNVDGGWGSEPGLESAILPTASTALILITAGYWKEAKSAIDFILSRYQQNTHMWPSPEELKPLTTALCALTLYRFYGKRNKMIKDSVASVKKELIEKGGKSEDDYIAALLLKESKARIRKLLYNFHDHLPDQDEKGGFPKGMPDIITTVIAINVLLDVGVKKSDERIRGAINFLINSRSLNGGWPSEMNFNSIYNTILTLLTLKRVNLIKPYFLHA